MEYNLIIILRLFAAHLLGDFIFQTDKIAENKSNNIKSLLIHSLFQALLAWLMMWGFKYWWIGLIIFITHFGIDFFKIKLENERKKQEEVSKNNSDGNNQITGLIYYIIDQILHILVIVLCWWIYNKRPSFDAKYIYELFNNKLIWCYVIALILLLKPSSLLINSIIKNFSNNDDKEGVEKAGSFIGYLERILIFIFVINGFYVAIGFLIAAKSIIRISGNNNSDNNKERASSEYVLIGTLLSFTIAILVSFSFTKYIFNI